MSKGPASIASRAELASSHRIVVKVGSSSLTDVEGGLDDLRLNALVDVLAAQAALGHEVLLVSSGAIAAGLAPLHLRRRPRDLATQQAAASVGQGLLVARYTAAFARHGHTVGQVLLTAEDVIRRTHYAQRPAHPLSPARPGRRAGHQRERHRGHGRDPVRRQRPAGRARRPPGARRRAAPALGRRRALRRTAVACRARAGSPRSKVRAIWSTSRSARPVQREWAREECRPRWRRPESRQLPVLPPS